MYGIYDTTKEKAEEFVKCGSRNLPVYPFVYDIINGIESPKQSIIIHAENENNNIIGYLMCQTLNGKDKMYISSVCVDKEYRRKGVGRSLIEECKEECKKRRVKDITLHVHTENEGAIKLYKECGFIIQEELSDYYGGIYENANTQNAYIMKYKVPYTGTSCFSLKSK